MNDNKGIFGVLALAAAVFVSVLAAVTGNGILAGIWSIAKVLIVGGAIVVLLIVALVVFFAFKDRVGEPKKGSLTEPKTTSAPIERDDKAIIDGGYTRLAELRRMVSRVSNKRIHELGVEVCTKLEKLLVTLREKPEVIRKARQFLGYYPPTLVTILDKYTQMEHGNVADDKLTDDVIKCLESMSSAADKQHRSLFDDDLLDLRVEMDVMEMIAKRDGLVTDENAPVPEKTDE